jgi:hypothetical protein
VEAVVAVFAAHREQIESVVDHTKRPARHSARQRAPESSFL